MVAEALRHRIHWARNVPARTALRLCNQRHVRSILADRYDKELQGHSRKLPKLGDVQTSIVEAVNRDGIFVSSLDQLALPGSDEILQKGASLAQAFGEKARALAAAGESYIMIPPDEIVRHPQFFLWGLQDWLLDIAESYIGLPPAYDGVVLNYTVADGREISTRKWHRDWEDRRMLKVFIYLNDVDVDGGPFQLVRRAAQQNDLEGFYYNLADDQELESRLGRSFSQDIVSCEGQAGTIIFMDAARFYHRGKPATARDRAALFYSYFARNPRHPFLCERTGVKRSDIARLCKGLPQRQLDTALWHRQLTPAMRLVPPATI